MSSGSGTRYELSNLKAQSGYEKANEIYLTFSLKGQSTKQKTPVLAHVDESYNWEGVVLALEAAANVVSELEVKNYVASCRHSEHSCQEKRSALQVAAYSKRTIVPDHEVGDFVQALPKVGCTETYTASLRSKSGEERGRVQLTVSAHSVGGTDPFAGARSKADEAKLRAAAVASEGDRKSHATASAAKGKTMHTVDGAEQKLQNVKERLVEGSPHTGKSDGSINEASITKPGAFNEALGMPRNANTTSDAPGVGPAATPPYEAAAGGAAGSVTGPVAPTGQGGVLAGTGATATGPATGNTGSAAKNLAYNAANKAQEALQSAKTRFSESEAASR